MEEEMKRKLMILLLASSMVFGVTGCAKKEEEAPATTETKTTETAEAPATEHGDLEWIGEYELKAGEYLFHFGESPEATLDIGVLSMDGITDLEHEMEHLMGEEKETMAQDAKFGLEPHKAYTLEMNTEEDHGHVYFTVAEDGVYAIGVQHNPTEFTMQVFSAEGDEFLPTKEHTITQE